MNLYAISPGLSFGPDLPLSDDLVESIKRYEHEMGRGTYIVPDLYYWK